MEVLWGLRTPYPSCSGGSRSDRIVKGIFWTTELVSAFSTMPPRNMVKLFAQACTTSNKSWSAPGACPPARASTAHGKSSQLGTYANVAADMEATRSHQACGRKHLEIAPQ